ncbi:hypothetical protein BCR35DRAFT_123549 [Leucosporidium creatinivorum]|uniref:F-box domain-containing protein n=1 Tax=Leucosporidium creatinivorum TaxID=106004 RepID=A0A1Y2EZY5_9BASI|nr:hypothetical protein BCR35DRAFT_123549 [Leucosporidium creatinivorum]
MKSLALDFGRQYSSALADQLAILKAKGVVLQELSFVLTSSRETVRVLNALLAWLVQGVRRLELDTSTQIDENFTLSTKLLLDTLRIGSLVPELPSFLLPFSSAAPRLTCLELQPWGGGLTPTLKASLCELAPQITDLTIGLPPFFEGRDPTVSSLESLLRACTSVTVLRIVNPRPSDLKQILSFLPNCVALVAIFRFEMVIFYDLTPTHLAEVLDLPCMAQLRRWRMPQMARWWGAMSGGGGRGVASSLSSERDRASRRRTLLH